MQQHESNTARHRKIKRARRFARLFETDPKAFLEVWDVFLTSAFYELRRFESKPSITTQVILNRIESALSLCPATFREEVFAEARSIMMEAYLNPMVSSFYREIQLDKLRNQREMAAVIQQDPDGEAKVHDLTTFNPDNPLRPQVGLAQAIEIVYLVLTKSRELN